MSRSFELGGRRETLIGPKGPDGFHRLIRTRIRSVENYDRIVRFRRCPKAARKIAQHEINKLLGSARRFAALCHD